MGRSIGGEGSRGGGRKSVNLLGDGEEGEDREPWLIAWPDEGLMAFAGLWDVGGCVEPQIFGEQPPPEQNLPEVGEHARSRPDAPA